MNDRICGVSVRPFVLAHWFEILRIEVRANVAWWILFLPTLIDCNLSSVRSEIQFHSVYSEHIAVQRIETLCISSLYRVKPYSFHLRISVLWCLCKELQGQTFYLSVHRSVHLSCTLWWSDPRVWRPRTMY